MKVLIADDNPRIRHLLKSLLRQHMDQVDTILECSDGTGAIALYEENRPDWILMDIAMEPLNGLLAAQRIIHYHPEAKIVIITQYNDPEYREAARKCGALAFLLKDDLSRIPEILKFHG